MKIDTAVLESMPSLPILSTGKSEEYLVELTAPPPKTPVQNTSVRNQETLPMMEWMKYAYWHAQAQGFTVVPTLLEAMQDRVIGAKKISLREADIAARQKLDLKKPLILAALQDGLIVEGIVGLEGNVYELRARYNRGVIFKKQFYAQAPESQQKQALDLMKLLLHQLAEQGVPAWEEEIREGFHESLCRPEYMTQAEYDREKVRYKKLLQTSGFVESAPVLEEEVTA